METDHYLLSDEEASLPRYRLFDEVYRAGTERTIGDVSVASDAAVLEVGCGIGLTACWLAESVVPEGRVVAFDRSAALVGIARATAAERGITNIEFATLAAEDLSVDTFTGPFDLVHTRYVLSYLPGSRDIMKRIVDVLAPGGTFVGEEIGQSYVTYDAPPWLSDQAEWFRQLIELGGGQPNYGWDGLPGDAVHAGLELESVWGYSPCDRPEALVEMLRLALTREMKDHLVGAGITTAEHVDNNAAAMREPLGESIVSGSASVCVIARRGS